MFGETVANLLLYLAPVEQEDLTEYGFDNTALTALLAEKADIVFSFLPKKYRCLYEGRVYRLVLEKFGYAGQTSVTAPFPEMTEIIGYLNPPALLDDFADAEIIDVAEDSGNLEFTALEKGDIVVIDFNNDMSGFSVPALAWAVKVLAAIDLQATLSGDLKTGELVPRIQFDAGKVFPWLEALSNHNKTSDRVVIRQLEKRFWEGKNNFAQDIDALMRNDAEGMTL